MEADSLWNTATYAAIAVAGLVLYFFYTCVITCLCVLSCSILNLHVWRWRCARGSDRICKFCAACKLLSVYSIDPIVGTLLYEQLYHYCCMSIVTYSWVLCLF